MASTLSGKTLFITGASRGIGLAIGLKAARDGANVAIAAKTAEPNPKLPGTIFSAAEEIEKAGGKALPLTVDVRDEAQVRAALDKTAADVRRRRYRGQQRERDFDDEFAGDRHEAFRSDASDQRARNLHGVEIRCSIPGEVGQPAYPDAVAAARSEGEMVCGQHRLFDGEIRHEPRRARPWRASCAPRASPSTRYGRARRSRPPRSRTCLAETR